MYCSPRWRFLPEVARYARPERPTAVLDGGAYIGLSTFLLAALTRFAGDVIAVEAHGANHELLSRNTEGASRVVQLWRGAVGGDHRARAVVVGDAGAVAAGGFAQMRVADVPASAAEGEGDARAAAPLPAGVVQVAKTRRFFTPDLQVRMSCAVAPDATLIVGGGRLRGASREPRGTAQQHSPSGVRPAAWQAATRSRFDAS